MLERHSLGQLNRKQARLYRQMKKFRDRCTKLSKELYFAQEKLVGTTRLLHSELLQTLNIPPTVLQIDDQTLDIYETEPVNHLTQDEVDSTFSGLDGSGGNGDDVDDIEAEFVEEIESAVERAVRNVILSKVRDGSEEGEDEDSEEFSFQPISKPDSTKNDPAK